MSVANVLSRRVDSYEPNYVSKIRCSLFKKIIAISKKIYDEISEVGIDKNKLTLIKSAVDLNQLSKQESKSVFLKKFNLEDDDFVIATVGQLIPRKGHEQLIEIFSELKRSHSRIKLLVFGQGKLEAHLRKISAENNLSKSIKFCGFLYDLDNYFSHFDLVVHCAVREGLGVSLLKAAAVGVPIVAFRVGGIPEVVDHKVTGLLSELGDKESLQKNIEYFIANKKFRLACSINAKVWIKNQFSIDDMIDKHTKLYENLI
jgi:glycosyltransferase involved in cell wall biosynthesis